MKNLSAILPLFCRPTWPSHHVSENQEFKFRWKRLTRARPNSQGRFYSYFFPCITTIVSLTQFVSALIQPSCVGLLH